MAKEPNESNGDHRDVRALGAMSKFARVALIAVVAVTGILAFNARIASRVQGSVEAETVGEEYVSAPCEVRSKYDGQKWTVTGVVVPRDPDYIPFNADPNEYLTLSGGTYVSNGKGCPKSTFRPFTEARAYTVDLTLHWDDSNVGVAEVGSTITVTCRLKLVGFGLNDGDGSISGSDCVPMEPGDS
jgi:hypothetical protein